MTKKHSDLAELQTELVKLEINSFVEDPENSSIKIIEAFSGKSPTELCTQLGVGAARLINGFINGQLGYEFAEAVKRLQGKKIRPNFLKNPYSKSAFQEVLVELDNSAAVDEGRLKILKFLFWAAADLNSDEMKQMTAYHFSKIAAKLDTMDIQVLSFCYQKIDKPEDKDLNHGLYRIDTWYKLVFEGINFALSGLIEQSIDKLVLQKLLHEKPDKSENAFNAEVTSRFRLTMTGLELCKMINEYEKFEGDKDDSE